MVLYVVAVRIGTCLAYIRGFSQLKNLDKKPDQKQKNSTDLTLWPRGSCTVVIMLSLVEGYVVKIKQSEKRRRSRVSRLFLARFGSALGSRSRLGLVLGLELGLGLGLGVGLGLCPYLDPTRKCSLARKCEEPTPKTRETRSLGELLCFLLAR